METKTLEIKGLGSFVWPAHDVECYNHIRDYWFDAAKPLDHVDHFGVCIQAGGNMGVWANYYGRIFDTVYTFEPDPTNFLFLVRNNPSPNVVKLQAALGHCHGMITTEIPKGESPTNLGALQVNTEPNAKAHIPVLRIDDLDLLRCDLIQLDVEGFELSALKGAEKTVKRFGPVIMLEDKGLSERYNVSKGEVVSWLESRGYKVAETINRDLILVRS